MSDMMNNPEQMSDLNRNRFFRQFLFLGVLIAIGVVLFRQLNFFVGAFLGAITIYIVLRNVMFRMVERHGFTRWVAALLLVMATALVLAGFGWISVRAVSSELSGLKIDGVLASMNSMLDSLNSRLGMHIIPEDIISRSDGVIKSIASGILNTTYSFTANIFMMLLVLYFMLTSGRHMESRILAYSPFTGGSLSLMQHEVKTMIYSNAVGMPVILVLQTLVSTLIYWLLGFGNPWFWGFLTALCGLLPILGTAFVYIPVTLWLFATGEMLNGLILLLYGLVVISNADNLFRIVLLRHVADTHPLIVIFGVLLGIPLFGFWGIIFGPLFISCFILLIRIYYMEYDLLKEQPSKAPIRKSVPHHFRKIHERCKK